MTPNNYAAAVAAAFGGGFVFMALMNLPSPQKPAEAPQATTAPSYTPPPETCDGRLTCLETRSVIGNSARDVDPASFVPSPDYGPPPAASYAPVPAPSDVPVPVGVASATDRVIERERIIEHDVPVVVPQTATSTFVVSERERIGRQLRGEADRPLALESRGMHQERVDRPVERRMERPIERRAVARAR